MEVIQQYFQYNSVVVLTYFLISLVALILNVITKGKTNKALFSCYRSSPLNPLTYVRYVTHVIGHSDWQHFFNNFTFILLIGPMIEEKYGSIHLLIMMLTTAIITGLFNTAFSKNKAILGASGIVFMMISLSAFVNMETKKVPLTLILIFLFFIVNEIISLLKKDDHISHTGHIIGAICGIVFGFII